MWGAALARPAPTGAPPLAGCASKTHDVFALRRLANSASRAARATRTLCIMLGLFVGLLGRAACAAANALGFVVFMAWHALGVAARGACDGGSSPPGATLVARLRLLRDLRDAACGPRAVSVTTVRACQALGVAQLELCLLYTSPSPRD